jgi:ABC-type branched-subunit amino acid transport system substrate-binding protein
MPKQEIKVSIIYAYADRELCKELKDHLSTLQPQVTLWQDQMIVLSDTWDGQIKTRLRGADVILLLVSSSFFAAQYCWEMAVQEAIERERAGIVRVIPIILRSVDWEYSLLGRLHALPTEGKPVTEWPTSDAALKDVVRGIRKAVVELLSSATAKSVPVLSSDELAAGSDGSHLKAPTNLETVPLSPGYDRGRESPIESPRDTSERHSLLPFDHNLCRDASLNDINMDVVASLLQQERVQKQEWFRPNMTDQELLEHLNLLRGEMLTYGAVLCFGRNPSQWVAEAFTRCILYKGNERLGGREEDREFRGSLLEQYESSMAFLQKNLRLMIVKTGHETVEQWEIPPVVLREALANALIHRDYAEQRNYVRVEIFDNRIEISSPGGLPGSLTVAQLGKEYLYPLRNPRIAHMFFLRNYGEKLGTGIARMRKEMKEAQLPTPGFDPGDGRTFKVILGRPQHVGIDLTRQPSFSLTGIELDTTGEPTLPSRGIEPDAIGERTLPSSRVEPDTTQESFSSSQGAALDPISRPTFSSRASMFVKKRRYPLLLSLFLVVLLLIIGILWAFSGFFPSADTGIDIITKPNNEQIGLSDGRYAFDTGTDRTDASLKKQAATKFAQGDKAGATSLWNQAVGKNGNDTSDAEALIYLENQRVLASGSPYITLVVGTMLSGDTGTISSGRDDLQGAYVAQKEYNDGVKLNGGKLVRLLIASAGSKSDYVTDVTKLIVQAAKQDSTIVGVMGWAYSGYTEKAIPVLSPAHIPLVSSTATADTLSGASPYFFRVVPSNQSQAIAGAKYAEQELHAKKVALFADPNNSYTRSLAADFKQQFVADGNQIVDTEDYTIGDRQDLPSHLQNALKSNPDLIYFSGYADDLAVLLINFPTSQPNLQVLGGDGLYTPNAYPPSAKAGFNRVRFTSFAYPDTWSILHKDQPLFFSEYSADYNPAHADHSANPYGYTRADFGTILAYDATFALLQGCQNVLSAKNTLTPDSLQHGLTQITGANAIQGVSGQISFKGGDPTDKVVVILYVDQDGYIHLLENNGVQGCFTVGTCPE